MTTVHKEKERKMNYGRLTGGIILLVLGVLLGILTFVLPEDQVMFVIDNENVPLVPAAIMVVIGIILISTSWEPVQEKVVEEQLTGTELAKLEERKAVNKRLENIGWGLFLIMLGGFALVPDEVVPKGLWSIGVGVLLLGLNASRYFYGLRMSGFTTFIGLLSLLGGVVQLVGFGYIEGALLFILLGGSLLLKPWFEKHQLFGKIEHSKFDDSGV